MIGDVSNTSHSSHNRPDSDLVCEILDNRYRGRENEYKLLLDGLVPSKARGTLILYYRNKDNRRLL